MKDIDNQAGQKLYYKFDPMESNKVKIRELKQLIEDLKKKIEVKNAFLKAFGEGSTEKSKWN